MVRRDITISNLPSEHTVLFSAPLFPPSQNSFAVHECVCLTEGMELHADRVPPSAWEPASPSTSQSNIKNLQHHSSASCFPSHSTQLELTILPSALTSSFELHWSLVVASTAAGFPTFLCGDQVQSSLSPSGGEALGHKALRQLGMETTRLGAGFP